MERIKKIKSGRLGPDGKNLIRNQRIELSASPDEYEQLENFALQSGYNTLASYVRETALEGLPIQGTKKTRLIERRSLITQLGNIGSNINQLSKNLNKYVVKAIVKDVDPNELIAMLMQSNLLQMKNDIDVIKKALVRK
jgi:hypothetical protein